MACVFATALAAGGSVPAAAAAPAARPTLPPLVDPPASRRLPGKFIWFDLVTRDPVASRRFYGDVFGWTFDAVANSVEDYHVIRADGVPIGGVFTTPVRGAQAGARWLSFASVADLDRSLAKLKSLGAKTLVEPTDVAGRGRHAIVRDPQGAILGLLQSATGDPADDPVGPGEFFWVDLYTRDVAEAARQYRDVGFTIVESGVASDRLVLMADRYARAGILPLPPEGRQPGWLPYVQVDDVAATLARARQAGGKVLREPSAAELEGQLAVIADPQGGVIGVIHWPSEHGAQP
jgi:predicted enzyme related to lactoylglutathione lyase